MNPSSGPPALQGLIALKVEVITESQFLMSKPALDEVWSHKCPLALSISFELTGVQEGSPVVV